MDLGFPISSPNSFYIIPKIKNKGSEEIYDQKKFKRN